MPLPGGKPCGCRSSVCTSSNGQSSPAACRCRNAHWFASTRFARSWYTWSARTMRTRRIGTSQPAPKTHHRPAWLTMSCTSETHCLNKLLDPLLLLPHYMPILPLRRMRNAARNAACRRECGIPQAQAYTCLSLTQSHYLNFNISPSPRRPRPRPRCALSWRRAGRVPPVGVVRRRARPLRASASASAVSGVDGRAVLRGRSPSAPRSLCWPRGDLAGPRPCSRASPPSCSGSRSRPGGAPLRGAPSPWRSLCARHRLVSCHDLSQPLDNIGKHICERGRHQQNGRPLQRREATN